MLTPSDDRLQFVRPDLSGPYAKLARHITAMYEIVCLAPTNDPAQPGNPSIGLSARDRMGVTEHLRECMEMIATLEKWTMNPVMVIDAAQAMTQPLTWHAGIRHGAAGDVFPMVDHGPVPGARPDRPEDYLDPEHVRRQREMNGRLRAERLLRISGEECPSCGRDNSDYGNVCTSDDCPGVTAL